MRCKPVIKWPARRGVILPLRGPNSSRSDDRLDSLKRRDIDVKKTSKQKFVYSSMPCGEVVCVEVKREPQNKNEVTEKVFMHRPGIEPGARRWQRRILPLNHQC